MAIPYIITITIQPIIITITITITVSNRPYTRCMTNTTTLQCNSNTTPSQKSECEWVRERDSFLPLALSPLLYTIYYILLYTIYYTVILYHGPSCMYVHTVHSLYYPSIPPHYPHYPIRPFALLPYYQWQTSHGTLQYLQQPYSNPAVSTVCMYVCMNGGWVRTWITAFPR